MKETELTTVIITRKKNTRIKETSMKYTMHHEDHLEIRYSASQ